MQAFRCRIDGALGLALVLGFPWTVEPLQAQWKTLLPQAGTEKVAVSHSLSYFTVDALPSGRLASSDVLYSCFACVGEEKLQFEKENLDLRRYGKATVGKLGEIRGFEIFVVDYTCQCTQQGHPFLPAKSLIVKTGPDEFRELLFARREVDGGSLSHEIVTADAETALLWSVFTFGGNHHPFEEYAFRFDKGPIRLNLEPVKKAASAALPQGAFLPLGGELSTFGTRIFTYRATVYPYCTIVDPIPCDHNLGGTVEVDFTLDGDQVTVLAGRYKP